MSSPNEELSPLAQELLAAHRELDAPDPSQSERVWTKVHASVFAAPVVALDPGSVTGVASSKAAAAAGVAKSGTMASVAVKAALIASVGGATAGGVLLGQDAYEGALQPAARVEPSLLIERMPRPDSQPAATKPPAVMRDFQLRIPDSPTAKKAVPQPRLENPVPVALQLTPALRAQLSALSAIDSAIRGASYARARDGIRRFMSQYPGSPFAADVQALEVIANCGDGREIRGASVNKMVQNPRLRRFWSRLRRACKL